jgi:hypothetical protein
MKKAVSSVGSVYSIIEKFEQLTDQVLVPTMLSDVRIQASLFFSNQLKSQTVSLWKIIILRSSPETIMLGEGVLPSLSISE